MGETKSIQVLLDTDLWARVRAKAALLKRSAASAVEEALTAWVGSDVRFHEMPGGTYRPGDTFRIGPPIEVEPDPLPKTNEGAADAGQVISDIMIEEHRSNARDPVRLVRGTALLNPSALERAPETACGRCRVPWKNHQEGSRKNRAGTTGCTTFEDPTPGVDA